VASAEADRPDGVHLPVLTPRTVDLLIAIAIAAVQVTATSFAAQNQDGRAAMDAGAYALLVAGPAALLFRRSFPVATLGFVFATVLAYWLLDYPRGPIFLALIVAIVTAVVRGHRTAAWTSLALGYLAFVWLGSTAGVEQVSLGQALGLAAWLLLVGAAAELLRSRSERAAQTERTRKQEELRRAGEERLRIARELHDVLAHNVSLINVQAGVALHLIEDRPEQARGALAAIKQASAETLREMRTVLGTLRRVDEDLPRNPPAGLGRLDQLVERMAAAGLEVEVAVQGSRRDLPSAVDLAAYRIVQEALTNVARHAGTTKARVQLTYLEGELVVEVEDDGHAAQSAELAEGNGIVGMRERSLALGGEFSAGPRAEGGFAVRSRLPTQELA
jgi:signal transduction histidine kinase